MRIFSASFERHREAGRRQCSHDDVQSSTSEVPRVAWFLGPRTSSWNGVGQHSLVLIRALTSRCGFQVDTIDIPAEPRSLKRYWWQFAIYPIRVFQRARSCDVVLLYQEDLSFLVPIARLAGGRVCVFVHHIRRPGQARDGVERLKSLYVRLVQPMIAKADLVLVPSKVTAQEVLASLAIPSSRLQVVPCPFDDRYVSGIDVKRSEARTRARGILKERFGISTRDAFVLLNVGSDETRKNNVTLFRAVARLVGKDIVVVRVGAAINSANRLECKAIAAESGVDAYFVDKVGDEDLGYFYQAADAHVSPSLHEGFGRTVIEAQIAGIPVIASGLEVYRETMGDSFLAINEPTNPVAWESGIARLMSDPSLVGELIERGKRNSVRYSSQVVGSLLRINLDRIIQKVENHQPRH